MFKRYLALFLFVTAWAASSAEAYIGPGAGFAVVNLFGFFAISFLIAFAGILVFPIRLLIHKIRMRGVSKEAQDKIRNKKVIVLGYDGMEPALVERMIKEGRLPNLASLYDKGGFKTLGTTWPPQSPVAWSTFATGMNPGKHNIFDFLARNKETYLPELSIAKITPPARTLKLGKYKFPISRPSIEALRKGDSFWAYLSRFGVFGVAQRVPVTFPPEKFDGRILSAMGTPDLLGTQGVYTLITTQKDIDIKEYQGRISFAHRNGAGVKFDIEGPQNPFIPTNGVMKINGGADVESDGAVVLHLGDDKLALSKGVYSPWTRLNFDTEAGLTVYGVARFLLLETEPEFVLYLTPINIDPENPAMPVSHPAVYAEYLSLTNGVFSTLGLAEDTSGMNDGILSPKQFLTMCEDIFEERKLALKSELDQMKNGLLVHVFDITDRVSHMFWGLTDKDHPAYDEKLAEEFGDTIEQVYKKCDELTGEVMKTLSDDDLLIILSDHGFGSYRYSFHLNDWLVENGYLVLKESETIDGMKFFNKVDWSKSKAYAMGLNGIYINLAGRESQGAVAEDDREKIKAEIIEKLETFTDDKTGQNPISAVRRREDEYDGPFVDNAPDLLIGYAPPYRASWQTVLGGAKGEVISPNAKSWGGDHCINPVHVPGTLFCNQPIKANKPTIADIAPTVIEAYGLPVPDSIDGKSFLKVSNNNFHGENE